MYILTVNYSNTDGQCRFDDEVRATMNWWHGQEAASEQDPDTHMRHITYAFESENDATKASTALAVLLGGCFKPVEQITSAEEPDGPEEPDGLRSTDPPIDFDSDQPPIPRECASVLGFNRSAGLEHRDDVRARGPRTVQVVFDSFARRLGWDLQKQADVLVSWFGEGLIAPLLQYIQEAGQTVDFAEFLGDNFADE